MTAMPDLLAAFLRDSSFESFSLFGSNRHQKLNFWTTVVPLEGTQWWIWLLPSANAADFRVRSGEAADPHKLATALLSKRQGAALNKPTVRTMSPVCAWRIS